VDPSKDHYLFTLREQAPDQAAILPLIDRLSERSRAALSESRAEVQAAGVAVAAAVTPNLEAYRHYFRGKDAFARMDMENAEKAFREALRLEPRFALAQYELALGGMLMAGRDKALLRDAVRNAAGAPEKEAALIGALQALDAGRFREAARLSAALAERFPDDPDVLYLAENALSWVGDFAATTRLLERLQRVSPDFSFSQMDYVYLLFMQGRAAEGQAFVRRVVEQGRSPGAGVVRGLASAVAGDLPAAIREVRAAGAQHPLGGWLLAQLLASNGQVREALAVHGDGTYYFFELSRAIALSYGGRLRDAERHLRAAMASPDADRGQMAVMLHWLLAAAGDEAGARAARPARDMAPAWDALAHFHAGDDTRLAAAGEAFEPGWEAGRLHAALNAWRAGRRMEALERLRALNREWIWLVPYYRGMAAAEEGLHAEAVEALSAFERSFYGFMDALFHPWLQARARIQLARSLGALGRKAEARAMIELQLTRWREADADLALLAEARALRRELGGRVLASRRPPNAIEAPPCEP
jgi:tetratricopeptide (TPR) repeat protein